MQYLLALGLAAGFAWLIGAIGSGTLERAISAMTQLIGGFRGDPWPRGIQEEDRDRPWGLIARAMGAPPSGSIHEAAAGAPTTRVRAKITTR